MILATIEPWPDLANCLAVLEPQVKTLGGEILVGDGHGNALTEDYVRESDCVSWIKVPGASVFELRARAAEAARGEIIATTEDHCVVGSDWCAAILEAFASHPEAQAVWGPILNGSREHWIDWANYLHTFGGFLPLRSGAAGPLPPNANVAYRRDVFPMDQSRQGGAGRAEPASAPRGTLPHARTAGRHPCAVAWLLAHPAGSL